jgi:uncharacterized membrane protein
LHDETLPYQSILIEAGGGAAVARRPLVADWWAFTVAFIALTFGVNQGSLKIAVLAAVTAVIVVATAGVMIRAPLARVPENAMKFAVGVMLTAFGIFGGAEGAGARWPGEDMALLVLIPAIALYAVALVALFLRRGPVSAGAGVPARQGID